jgi:hypothetical protein
LSGAVKKHRNEQQCVSPSFLALEILEHDLEMEVLGVVHSSGHRWEERIGKIAFCLGTLTKHDKSFPKQQGAAVLCLQTTVASG